MTNRTITGELLQSRGDVEFEWRIFDFTPISVAIEPCYRSRSFQFMDSEWYLCMNKYDGNSGEWISLFVTRIDPGPSKSMNFTFEIKNDSLLVDKFQKLYSDCGTFGVGVNHSWGRRELIKISELYEKKSSLLPSGILTLRCCLKNADAEKITERPQPVKLTELDTLSGDLEKLLVRSANYDITLNVQNKEFRTHRLILAARSEVFAAMFEHELSESTTNVVEIVDCDPDSFGDFLRYLYTGKAEGFTQDKVPHLYKTADKYAILKLKSFCVEFMAYHLSADNVCTVATLAQLHEEEELFASVQAFFNKNVAKILSTKSWEKLLREDYLLANKLLKDMTSKIKIQD